MYMGMYIFTIAVVKCVFVMKEYLGNFAIQIPHNFLYANRKAACL